VRQRVQPGHDHPRLLGGDEPVALSDSDHREHIPHGVGVGVDGLGDVRVHPVAVPQQRPRRPRTHLGRNATVVDLADDGRDQPGGAVGDLTGGVQRDEQVHRAAAVRRRAGHLGERPGGAEQTSEQRRRQRLVDRAHTSEPTRRV